jgi:hypothetical protein
MNPAALPAPNFFAKCLERRPLEAAAPWATHLHLNQEASAAARPVCTKADLPCPAQCPACLPHMATSPAAALQSPTTQP